MMGYSDILNQQNSFPSIGDRTPMPNDDASLLQALRTNPTQEAFALLCDNHAKSAFNLAKSITRDQHLAEEAVQETMVTLWKWHNKLEPGDLHSWIMRAVVNKSMNLNRSRTRRENATRRFQVFNIASDSSSTESTENNEQLLQLKVHISELSTADRELVALRFVANLSQAEIAKQLEVPQTTVSARIRRVLKFLRAKLTASGLTASPLVIEVSDIQFALTHGENVAPEFLVRLAKIPHRTDWVGFILNYRVALGSVLAILLFAPLGLSWLNATSIDHSAVESSSFNKSPTDSLPASKNLASSISASGADFEKLYEDDFEGSSLDPFWAKVPEPEYLHFYQGKKQAHLVLNVDHTKALKNDKPIKIELESAPIDLSGSRSLFIRFSMLTPEVSGTVEYGNQILNADGTYVYNLGARVTYMPEKDGYQVLYLQSTEMRKWKKPKMMERLPSCLWQVNLTTLAPRRTQKKEPLLGDVQRQFKLNHNDDFSIKTQSTHHINQARIRFFITVYPGGRIKWRLDNA